MCVIFVDSPDAYIPGDWLGFAIRANPDGAGLMWGDGRKLHVQKGMWSLRTLRKRYDAARRRAVGSVVVHLRLATHGSVDRANCHPFVVGRNLGLAHNGVIDVLGLGIERRPEESDTAAFAREISRWPLRTLVRRDSFANVIGSAIGWSKLAFLNERGEAFLVNGDEGVVIDGVWCSNDHFLFGRRKRRKVDDAYAWLELQTRDEETFDVDGPWD